MFSKSAALAATGLGTLPSKRLAWGGVLATVAVAAELQPYAGNALAFTSPLVQPKTQAFRYVTNSSIDWGQNDERIAAWVEQVKNFPGVDPQELPAFGERMFGGDFLFGVSKDFMASCKLPSLLMPGDDMMHPMEVSYEIVRLMPHTEVVAPWPVRSAS